MKVSEMTDEQTSDAIMQGLGMRYTELPPYGFGQWEDKNGKCFFGARYAEFRDEYPKAWVNIHRAEMELICPNGLDEEPDWDMIHQYESALELVVLGDFYDVGGAYLFITSTPRQRAEALVRVLGGGE